MAKGPDFIVTGAPLAGVGLLSAWLAAHPGIHLPPDPPAGRVPRSRAAATSAPCPFYAGHGAGLARDDADDMPGAVRRGQLAGAVSRLHLQSPDAAAAIAATRPDCRIVLVLREPVGRAFAQFTHHCRIGLETTHDFAAALAEEELRRVKGWSPHHLYRAGSSYLDGVRRFRRHFGPDRLMIVLHEEIGADPEAVFEALCLFLGVWPDDAADNDAWPLTAASATPPEAGHVRAATVTRLLRAIVPAREPRLDPAVAAALARSFAPQMAAIEEEVGISLDPWRYAHAA